MTEHDPNRLQWNAVLKVIRDTENQSMSIYALAEKLNVSLGSVYLDAAIQQLIKQGRARVAIGKHARFGVCKFVNLISPRKSRRDMIDDKEEDNSTNQR